MAEKLDRILVIDDDEMARESFSEILTLEGYTVESADSAEKAIEIMKKRPVHLFMIDIMLPKMSGIELLKKLDIKNNIYEAIIITAYGEMDTAKEAMELGAFSYVSKPVEYKDLAPLVKKASEIVAQKKAKIDYLDGLEIKVEERTKKLEREIAEKKLVEEILRESEERYRNLFEQAPMGIGVATLDGKIVFANRKMAETTGYSEGELKKISLFSTYDNPKEREKLITTVNRDGIVTDFPARLKRKDGTLYDAELSVSKVCIGGQDLLQTICVDVTEHKQAEALSEQYKNDLNEAQRIAHIGSWIYNLRTSELRWSDEMFRIFGIDPENVPPGWPEGHEKLYHLEDWKWSVKEIEKAIKEGRNYELENRVICPDGSIKHTHVRGEIIKDASGQPEIVMGTIQDITESKKLERELIKREKQYRRLFEESNDAIFIHNAKGEILDVNRAACEMLGYDRNTLTVLRIQLLHPPKERQKAKNALENMVKTERIRFESIFKRADGKIIDVEISSRIIDKEDGLIQGIVRDITERKKAEEALRESHDYLNKLTDSMWDAVLSVKMPERVIDWINDSYNLIGYKPIECIGKTTEFLYSGKSEFLDFGTKLKNTIASGKDILHAEQLLKRKDGEVFPAEITTTIFKEKGEIARVTSIVRDITERKKAEEAIKQKNTELNSFINNIPDMAWLKDVNSNFIAANKAFGDAVGMDPEYLINHTCEVCFGKEAARKFKEDDKKVIKIKKQTIIEESIIDAKKNKVWLETVKSPIIDESGEVIGTVGVARNITDRKKTSEALQESERKLSEQNIMLQEKNIALREVMDQLEAEKDRLGNQINSNVDRLLLPLVTKLRSKGSEISKTYLDLLEENLKELTSQFANKMSDKMFRLTQKEIEMSNMIKQGLTSKEIANLLNISHRTVETHRNNIRKKLGIGKQEVNLVTYLKSIA